MQRDITSFFTRIAPPKKSKEDAEEPMPVGKKKRTARIISSDEDEVPDSPKVLAKTQHKKQRLNNTSPKESKTINKKPSLSKLKHSPKKTLTPVDPSTLFGSEALRVEAKRPSPQKPQVIPELADDEIDTSIMEIDLSAVEGTVKREKHRSKSKTPRKDSESQKHRSPKREESLDVTESKINKTPKSGSKEKFADEKLNPKKDTPRPKPEKEKSASKAKKEHAEDLDSSILSDEDKHARKRMAAILYQKYKNRTSVINPGCKEVPKGTPNCLAGLSFLVTGVLESLERDEAGSIIKEYGGKIMSTVGKRLNYLIVGEDAGPKKLAQAEEFGINVISEDGLFDLIREKSGQTTGNGIKVKEEKPSTSHQSIKRPTEEVKIKMEKSPKKAKLEKSVKEENSKSPNKPKLEKSVKKKSSKSPKKPKLEKPVKDDSSKVKREVKEEPLERQSEHESSVLATTSSTDNDNILAWVDKYKPTSVNDIVGQYGQSSNAAKLSNWLSKWYTNHDGKKKLQRPNPWAKSDDGSFFKAVLFSGPPGIGKTTTATLVCKELGFDTVEFNASDTRSKRLLKEEVAELLSNKSLYGYFHGQGKGVTKKHVLIMDEVDGMAGNEDRGGIQELISLIKESSVPIICMCNDRNHQKMRSLVNYCYDLRFNRPRLQQIKGRIMSICCKENFKIEPSKVEEIIAATNNDIRQTINHISLLSAGKEMQTSSDKTTPKTAEKDLKLGPWEVVRKVFSADEHKNMSINDKSDLFFYDYSLGPLFVQQNYLQVSPVGPKTEITRKVALTADALSLGDLVEKRIRSNSAWSLLPTQAVFSSVMPGEYMCGHFTGQINFPGWLGKNSRANKRNRLAQEIHDHTRLRTSGSRQSIRLDYAPFLLNSIVGPLKEKGLEGVSEALNVIKEYHLLREDIESLIELTTWPGKKGPMDAVDGRVKAALTRSYNKEVLAYSYSASAGVKKKKAEASENNELFELEGEEGISASISEDEEEDKLENDGLIKAKKHTAGTKAASKASKGNGPTATKKTAGKASTSKAKK